MDICEKNYIMNLQKERGKTMENKVILFQGDSITDCGRDKEKNLHNGRGYAQLVQAQLTYEEPFVYTCYNRGVSGNRVVDLYARIKNDMINLKPDYMSILIGINDVWHEYTRQNGVDTEKFEMVYGLIIEELKKEIPDLKLMLLEPFVLPGSATENTEEHPTRWEYFRSECDKRRAAVRRLAEKYNLVFVPLQELFDEVNKNAPAGYWLKDGVHPTPAGHELIKRQWLEGFDKLRIKL